MKGRLKHDLFISAISGAFVLAPLRGLFPTTMSKRKYADFRQGQNGRPNGSESKLYTQNGHIDSLLDLGKRTIFQSLKVARGFERQKLGRRQKAAKSAKIEADIKRHETEIQALKVYHRSIPADYGSLNLSIRIWICQRLQRHTSTNHY